MIQISDTARTQLLDLLTMSNQKSVLLSISSKGCGGHTYQLDFTHQDGGVALDAEHSLIIDEKSAAWLVDIEMDFVDDGMDSHFEFANPAEIGRCGCQQSFRIKT